MITDAFDGFSFFGRFGFAGSVGLAAPHALHRFADALLSSVHESHVHRGPASAGGSRRRGAAAGGGGAAPDGAAFPPAVRDAVARDAPRPLEAWLRVARSPDLRGADGSRALDVAAALSLIHI